MSSSKNCSRLAACPIRQFLYKTGESINSQVGEIKYLLVSYTDDTHNRFYFTLSTKYPVNPSEYNVEKGLDGARDGQAKSANMTVTSEKKISFNGIPGREITLQGSKGEAVLSRIFIDPEGPTLYSSRYFNCPCSWSANDWVRCSLALFRTRAARNYSYGVWIFS